MALGPKSRWARFPPDGVSRSTSARHTGSSVAATDCTAGVRSQSATGARASRPDVPKHWAMATTAPCRRAISAMSATRRVFPTPAPPRTMAMPGCPDVADAPEVWSTPSFAVIVRRALRRQIRSARARAGSGDRPVVSGALSRTSSRSQGLAGRRVGDDAELALEYGRAVVVGADGGRPVADVGLQLHQGSVAVFLQWLQGDPAPGDRYRACQITLLSARATHQDAQVDALALELLASLQNPVVVARRARIRRRILAIAAAPCTRTPSASSLFRRG